MYKIINKIKELSPAIKSSIIYTISNIVSKGLIILTTPIFTRIMLPSQIGITNLYTSWYSMLCVLASLSLTSGGYQVAMKEFKKERDRYDSSVLTLTTLISTFFAIIFFINPNFWSKLFQLPTSIIGLMIFGFYVYPAREFWLARQRYEYNYKLSGCVMIVTAIMASILSVFFVLYANKICFLNTGFARLLGNYIVIYGVAFILFCYIFLKGKTFYNKKFWKFSLELSIPLIGNSIATQVLNVSDRVMIAQIIGEREVGIYGTIYTISSASQLVWSAINASFVPYLFENIERRDKRKLIKQISNTFMISYALVAVIISLLAPEIIKLLATEEYLEAIYLIPSIATGIFMISLTNLYSNILIYYRSTKYVMIASSIAAIINVTLNIVFIPKFGYIAAAYTTLISYLIMAIFQCIISNRIHKKLNLNDFDTVYDDVKIFKICSVVIASCFVTNILYLYFWLRIFIIVIMLVICYIFRYKIINIIKETKKRD